MRTILLPTDFSENARNAIAYAINLFGENANYVLFHSYYVTFKKSTMFLSIDETLKKEAEHDLKEEKDFFVKQFTGKKITINTHVTGGELTEEINNYGSNKPIDFIVMGTKGASGVKEVLIGSNAANVFGKVNFPVLTVPENGVFSNLNNVVFAADYERINSKVALAPFLRLVKDHHSKVLVVHAPNDNKNSEEAAERLNLASLFLDTATSFHSVEGDVVDEAINDFAIEHDADLLVMLARGGGFLHKLLHPSVTKRVAFHAKIPVLVLHDNT